MVARGTDGETRAFPVVETVHRDSICWVTETPAAPPPDAAEATDAADAADLHTWVAQLAEAAVKALAGAGANAAGCRLGCGSSLWLAGTGFWGDPEDASCSICITVRLAVAALDGRSAAVRPLCLLTLRHGLPRHLLPSKTVLCRRLTPEPLHRGRGVWRGAVSAAGWPAAAQ